MENAPRKTSRHDELSGLISNIKRAAQAEAEALVAAAQKAFQKKKLEITSKVGQIGRTATSQREELVHVRDGKLKAAKDAREAALRKVQGDYDKGCRAIAAEYEASRDAVNLRASQECKPFEEELNAKQAELGGQVQEKVTAIRAKAEKQLEPLQAEVDGIEARIKETAAKMRAEAAAAQAAPTPAAATADGQEAAPC